MAWEYWAIGIALAAFGYWLEDAISEIRERTRNIEERIEAMQREKQDAA